LTADAKRHTKSGIGQWHPSPDFLSGMVPICVQNSEPDNLKLSYNLSNFMRTLAMPKAVDRRR
jgi:hypothetical protein